MATGFALCLAMILDAVLGEPDWLWRRMPHPAVMMGRVVTTLDRRLNDGGSKKAKGVLAAAVLLGAGLIIGATLALLGPIAEIAVAAILLAQRSLMTHVAQVAQGLRLSLTQGRRSVAMIVSRDTSDMDESSVARSAIESGAENLSDGVIAPAFWFLVLGLPGLLAYKFINTADSMIGYRSAKYADFGWASAKLDDLLNLIPARLTAALIALPQASLDHWKAVRADALLHKSPNAGWPEAAMARRIDVSLAGPRAYDGVMQPLAWVNSRARRKLGPDDIDACLRVSWQVWAVMLILGLLVGLSAS